MNESISALKFEQIQGAVAGTAAAFRSITRLEPAAGPDGKIFPPTYWGGKYLSEKRRIQKQENGKQENGQPKEEIVDAFLMASVQACANLAEEALLEAVRAGRLELPLIEVDFEEINPTLRRPLERITSLQAPHRLADAILRDSVLPDGTRFSNSTYAKAWGASNVWNATAIYELAPHALVFGLWGSPKKPGGLGAKFERAMVSEIVAVDGLKVDSREGFRIDPCGASSKVRVLPNEDGSFQVLGVEQKGKEQKGALRPSQINHSNIRFESDNGGVYCRYIEHSTVISLPALRRLKFPLDGNKSSDPHIDNAARTVLASLALTGATLAAERGMDLRSRCLLHEIEPRQWELIDKPGSTPEKFSFDSGAAIAQLRQAIEEAEKAGLKWTREPILLKPSAEFAELIRLSQEQEAAEDGKEDTRK